MRKNKKKIISLIILLISIFSCLVILFIPRENILMVSNLYYECDEEFVGSKDYMFIAKINNKTKTKRIIEGKLLDIPRTFYDIEVIDIYKGDSISKESEIIYYGGRLVFNLYCYYNSNYGMLHTGEYYLFIASMNEDKDLVISQDIQYVLLEGYDDSKEIEQQDISILNIINKYKNYI